MTELIMNPPEEYELDPKDIVKEYLNCQNFQKEAKIYNLPVKRVKEIVKNNELF